MPDGAHGIRQECRNEAEVFVEDIPGRPRVALPRTRSEGHPTMYQSVIEAQARYLIEDRTHTTRRTQSTRVRRHHRRLRTLSWL